MFFFYKLEGFSNLGYSGRFGEYALNGAQFGGGGSLEILYWSSICLLKL
jgi:hypothetical protein